MNDDSLVKAIGEIADEISLAKEVISAMGNAVSIIDFGFRVLYQNRLHQELTGDQKGKFCYSGFRGKERVCEDCPVAMAYADGNVHTIERPSTNTNGPLWVEITASPLRDGQGRIVAGIEIVRDISARKRAEEELQGYRTRLEELVEARTAQLTAANDRLTREITERRKAMEASEKYERIVSASPDHISILGRDYIYKEINPAYIKAHGQPYSEIVGRSVPDMLGHELFEKVVRENLDRCLAGETVKYEAWFDFAAIGRRFMSVTYYPYYDGDDVISGVVVSSRDITETKKAEREMKFALLKADQERAKSEAIIAAIGDGVSIQDADFRVLYQNQIHKDLMGDHGGEHCYKAFQERDGVCDDCPVERSLRDGKVHRAEKEVAWPDGTRYLEHTASPLKDADGRIIAGVKIIRDITDRKKADEELIRAEKLESLGLLSGGIAHDFNNLLSALIGNISLARIYTDPKSRVYDLLSEAERASSLAKDLTQQLLTYSRGGQPLKKIFSLPPLLRGSAEFALRGSNVRFELSAGDDIWTVGADEGQLSQVVNNLIINAQQAMPKGGTIRIRCDNIVAPGSGPSILKEGRYVRVLIEDEGIGIPRKYLDKIFDPYFTTKQKGSGLGLATAYSIIRKHEGYLTVESTPGVGTTFTIFIPASGQKAAETQAEARPLMRGRGKVLVMDDEEVIRLIVGRMLESLGYTAESAERGEEAVEIYQKALRSGEPIDAVIIDLTIRGGMGGLDCMKALREIDPNVRAIVSSGYSEDPVMAHHDTFGFGGIIVKPYRIEDLGEILHRVLGDRQEE
ncbi:MAG: PAS domain-containing protein [Nitrospiraceae bacterium]|nr:PAS domain-containing protein [Nitrospiraceae bacterium]